MRVRGCLKCCSLCPPRMQQFLNRPSGQPLCFNNSLTERRTQQSLLFGVSCIRPCVAIWGLWPGHMQEIQANFQAYPEIYTEHALINDKYSG